MINLNLLGLISLKLSISCLLSFIIAFERELHSHPGGACTHILVGFGSCLFTLISIHLKDKYQSINGDGDPARICAQIVSGMGFLGSATIFKSKDYIKGINTAANLWISAAISMGIAADLWEFSIITSLFTVIVLLINNRYKNWRYSIIDTEAESETRSVNDVNIDLSPNQDAVNAPFDQSQKDD